MTQARYDPLRHHNGSRFFGWATLLSLILAFGVKEFMKCRNFQACVACSFRGEMWIMATVPAATRKATINSITIFIGARGQERRWESLKSDICAAEGSRVESLNNFSTTVFAIPTPPTEFHSTKMWNIYIRLGSRVSRFKSFLFASLGRAQCGRLLFAS